MFFALVAAVIFVNFVLELVLLYQRIRDDTYEFEISSIVLYALGAAIFFLCAAHGAGVFLTPHSFKLLLIFIFAIMSSYKRRQFFTWLRSPACPSWYRWYFNLIRTVTFVFCLAVICIIVYAVIMPILRG